MSIFNDMQIKLLAKQNKRIKILKTGLSHRPTYYTDIDL